MIAVVEGGKNGFRMYPLIRLCKGQFKLPKHGFPVFINGQKTMKWKKNVDNKGTVLNCGNY